MVSIKCPLAVIAGRNQVHPFVERTCPRGASYDHPSLGEGLTGSYRSGSCSQVAGAFTRRGIMKTLASLTQPYLSCLVFDEACFLTLSFDRFPLFSATIVSTQNYGQGILSFNNNVQYAKYRQQAIPLPIRQSAIEYM